ncbi:MAG: hypothetical protein ACI8ZO_001349 [Flavobacteriales bacterium]|jgi:hypothetical protein
MTTLKLKVNDRILDKILWFLKQFKSDDLEIINESSFEEDQNYFQEQLARYETGNAKSYSYKELDAILEQA